MARAYKAHSTRKSELLVVGQKLFYTKGFEKTTIEDIMAAAGVSKGAFYHHFRSKGELLDALVEQLSGQIIAELKVVFDDPDLGVLEKFKRAVNTGRTLKVSNKDIVKQYAKMAARNENLELKHKINRNLVESVVPLYASMIEQGIREKIFNTESPQFAARMIVTMGLAVSDIMMELFAAIDEKPENVKNIYEQITHYENAIERLLGAPHGSLVLANEEQIREFRKEKRT